MPDVRNKYVPPSLQETAFNCPHCGVLTQQHWHVTRASRLGQGDTPKFVSVEEADSAWAERNPGADQKEIRELARKRVMATGRPFLAEEVSGVARFVFNLSLSKCYNCREIAVWRSDQLLWPAQTDAPVPNDDLPDVVKDVYNEASSIVHQSPRGASALLRLGIQILCTSLGEEGKNLNSDIKSLVRKGLDPRVQKALDVVRVVGNHSVHPGQIDMKDDQATAMKLFGLVNLIADVMVTQPKRIDEMYADLPEKYREAIERRDGK